MHFWRSERSETIIHALQDCARVKEVWRLAYADPIPGAFWGNDVRDWLMYNLKELDASSGYWDLRFVTILDGV